MWFLQLLCVLGFAFLLVRHFVSSWCASLFFIYFSLPCLTIQSLVGEVVV